MSALDQLQLAYDERPLPEDISSILRRAIASDPQDRFSSAVEFKKELDRLLYGGAYSPTTFNLALFVDRLFRPEIDAEERQRTIDESIDVTPYLHDRSRSRATEEEIQSPSPPRHHTGLWIGVSAVIVAAAITFGSWLAFGDRPSHQPPPPATPTAAQLAERQLQQERYLQQLVEELVQQKMAEREDEIRKRLREYQSRIEELQRQLSEAEQRSSGVTAQEGELPRQ